MQSRRPRRAQRSGRSLSRGIGLLVCMATLAAAARVGAQRTTMAIGPSMATYNYVFVPRPGGSLEIRHVVFNRTDGEVLMTYSPCDLVVTTDLELGEEDLFALDPFVLFVRGGSGAGSP